MTYSTILDDLSSAVNGYGRTVDIASELGLTAAQPVVYGQVIPDSQVTGGAVQLQYGTASASGITWTNFGSPVTVSAHTPATVGPVTGVAATLVRFVVTTPIAGGKVTGIITV
jgi:hypothetical protein